MLLALERFGENLGRKELNRRRSLQGLKSWLGGLDSNQDNQIQNLMYCQLYDLPAVGLASVPRALHSTVGRVFAQPLPGIFEARL